MSGFGSHHPAHSGIPPVSQWVPSLPIPLRLLLDELGQISAGGGFGLREEGRRVLQHQAVQRSLLGAVSLVMDRGTIRRPEGLPADGLHARLPRL